MLRSREQQQTEEKLQQIKMELSKCETEKLNVLKTNEQLKEELDECEEEIEYDYCPSCGWQKTSHWYSRSLSKAGIDRKTVE